MSKTSEITTFELNTEDDQSTCICCGLREKDLVCINNDENMMAWSKFQPTMV